MADEKMSKLEELMEKKFSKCMIGVNKNHEQMQKVSANSLTNSSKIDLCYNKITGFSEELEKFKKSIGSLLIAQEKSIKRMNTMAVSLKNTSSINVGVDPTHRSNFKSRERDTSQVKEEEDELGSRTVSKDSLHDSDQSIPVQGKSQEKRSRRASTSRNVSEHGLPLNPRTGFGDTMKSSIIAEQLEEQKVTPGASTDNTPSPSPKVGVRRQAAGGPSAKEKQKILAQ